MADEQAKIAQEQVPVYEKAIQAQRGDTDDTDPQANIAQEQLPLYEKATKGQTGSSDETQSGKGEGTASSGSIESPKPPASSPGVDNPTGGMSEGAGGLSSTAHIESPVPNNDQSLLSTVKTMLGFGATEEEIKAEDKGPAEDATTAPKDSLLAGPSTIAAPVAAITGSSESKSSSTDSPAAGLSASSASHSSSTPASVPSAAFQVAALTGISATTSTAPATTTTTSSDLHSGTGKGTYLDYQQASSTTDPTAFPSSQVLPIRSTPGGSLPSETTSASATKTDTKSPSTESTEKKTTTTSSTDESSDKMTDSSHKPPVPADAKHHANLENIDAIPTAGGKKLGEENWGQSDIVPDDPGVRQSNAGISSADGQPTDQVKDNTAKNTGGASGGPHGHGSGSGEGKESLKDKIKEKLHIGGSKK